MRTLRRVVRRSGLGSCGSVRARQGFVRFAHRCAALTRPPPHRVFALTRATSRIVGNRVDACSPPTAAVRKRVQLHLPSQRVDTRVAVPDAVAYLVDEFGA